MVTIVVVIVIGMFRGSNHNFRLLSRFALKNDLFVNRGTGFLILNVQHRKNLFKGILAKCVDLFLRYNYYFFGLGGGNLLCFLCPEHFCKGRQCFKDGWVHFVLCLFGSRVSLLLFLLFDLDDLKEDLGHSLEFREAFLVSQFRGLLLLFFFSLHLFVGFNFGKGIDLFLQGLDDDFIFRLLDGTDGLQLFQCVNNLIRFTFNGDLFVNRGSDYGGLFDYR